MGEVIPLVLYFFILFFVPSTCPQLTLRSVDFRSVHPKMCFRGGCVLLGRFSQGIKSSPFTSKTVFNGANLAIVLRGSEYETPLMVNDSSVKVTLSIWVID